MRKITAGLFIALDGVVEAPDQWHFPYFNDEMGAAVDGQLGAADTILLGRKTYDSFAGAWPDREAGCAEDAEFAKKLGDTRKMVVSRQNLQFTWRNSEQIKGDLAEAVVALKNEPGGDIGMSGSVSVVRPLLAAGLLDAPAGAPDRGRQGHAPVRRGGVDPSEAAVISDVSDGCAVPRLCPGRRPRRRGLRRSQGASAAMNSPRVSDRWQLQPVVDHEPVAARDHRRAAVPGIVRGDDRSTAT